MLRYRSIGSLRGSCRRRRAAMGRGGAAIGRRKAPIGRLFEAMGALRAMGRSHASYLNIGDEVRRDIK